MRKLQRENVEPSSFHFPIFPFLHFWHYSIINEARAKSGQRGEISICSSKVVHLPSRALWYSTEQTEKNGVDLKDDFVAPFWNIPVDMMMGLGGVRSSGWNAPRFASRHKRKGKCRERRKKWPGMEEASSLWTESSSTMNCCSFVFYGLN